MDESLKIIHLKKDNLELRFTILLQLITSHRLALDRIEEAKQFVKSEVDKALLWKKDKNVPINVKFFYYFGSAVKNLDGDIDTLDIDYINFTTAKSDWLVNSEDSLKWIVNNSKLSLNQWQDVYDRINQQLSSYVKFAKNIKLFINEFDKKIIDNVYDSDNNSGKSIKKVKSYPKDFKLFADYYIKACLESNSESRTARQLENKSIPGASKSNWDRYFKDPLFLIRLNKEVNKRLNNKRLSNEKKDVLIKVMLDVQDKMNHQSEKLIRNKTIPFDERLEVIEQQFDELSQ